jgi:hypothetical protein
MEEFDTNGSRSRRFPGKRRPAASPRCCEGERRGRERKRVWGEEPGRASFILSASVLFPKKNVFFYNFTTLRCSNICEHGYNINIVGFFLEYYTV